MWDSLAVHVLREAPSPRLVAVVWARPRVRCCGTAATVGRLGSGRHVTAHAKRGNDVRQARNAWLRVWPRVSASRCLHRSRGIPPTWRRSTQPDHADDRGTTASLGSLTWSMGVKSLGAESASNRSSQSRPGSEDGDGGHVGSPVVVVSSGAVRLRGGAQRLGNRLTSAGGTP
jgi:hypothetical protein